MSPVGCPLPPSSSLPSLRSLEDLTVDRIFKALEGLSAIYCPLPVTLASTRRPSHSLSTDIADSGYASGEEDDPSSAGKGLDALRADAYERNVAERWLTGFIARAEELSCFESEDDCQKALDQASIVLESFYTTLADEEDDFSSYRRDFSFEMSSVDGISKLRIAVSLNDGLAGTNPSDPDDVGLQSWGASIIFSDMVCAAPDHFRLNSSFLGTSPRIYELGAGTGLVSLVLGALLPHLGMKEWTLVATDYHPAVLENLAANVATNFSSMAVPLVKTALLDWSAPCFDAPLDGKAEMLLATDVVYAIEHATWLRDCATQLLAPEGVFWLMVAVRQNGRFDGIGDTVETAFASEDRPKGADGRRLTILATDKLEKRSGVGRGDESGYKLFRIGWA